MNGLPRPVLIELLADVLRENPPPASQAKYEFRKYADRIADALGRVSLELTGRPKVIALQPEPRRSSRQTRETARSAWLKRMEETGDAVCAFEAALRVTLAREPHWSLAEAVRHTVTFVVPK